MKEACAHTNRALEIIAEIKPILKGEEPGVQGAVLAELLSLWLAGWAPQLRKEVLDFHLEEVRELTKLNEKILFGDAGHPGTT